MYNRGKHTYAHTGYPDTTNAIDNNKRDWNQQAGCPHTLENRENRENGEKNPCREKSGNLKKSYLCKVKIFKFYSCSDVATGGFFMTVSLKS